MTLDLVMRQNAVLSRRIDDLEARVQRLTARLEVQTAALTARAPLASPERQREAMQEVLDDAARRPRLTVDPNEDAWQHDAAVSPDPALDAEAEDALTAEMIARMNARVRARADRAAVHRAAREAAAEHEAEVFRRAQARPDLVGFYPATAPTVEERAQMGWAGFTELPPAAQAAARAGIDAGSGKAWRTPPRISTVSAPHPRHEEEFSAGMSAAIRWPR